MFPAVLGPNGRLPDRRSNLRIDRKTGLLLLGAVWAVVTGFYLLFFYAVGRSADDETAASEQSPDARGVSTSED